jgi:hypothetical protein
MGETNVCDSILVCEMLDKTVVIVFPDVEPSEIQWSSVSFRLCIKLKRSVSDIIHVV